MAHPTIVKLTIETKGPGSGCCNRISKTMHRFLLPIHSSFEELDLLVRQATPKITSGASRSSLFYVDDDGDAIQLCSDKDLQAAMASVDQGQSVLRLRLERTVESMANHNIFWAQPKPCCFVKSLFAFMLFFLAVKWCCPCMFAIMFIFAISRLARMCCHVNDGNSNARRWHPPTWRPAVFTCVQSGYRSHDSDPSSTFDSSTVQKLAKAWDIGTTEALHALQLAQTDSSICSLICEAIKYQERPAKKQEDNGNCNSVATTVPDVVKADSSTTATTAPATDTGTAAEHQSCGDLKTSVATEAVESFTAEIPTSRRQVDTPPSAGSVLPSPISAVPAQALNFDEKLAVLTSTMGFEQEQALSALKDHQGDVRLAIQQLILQQ